MDLNYKYPKAKIYCIWYGDRLLYTGSSINFSKRKSNHKSDYNNNKGQLYEKLKEEDIQYKDLEFIIYKEYPCNDLNDLRKEEGNCIKELKPEFNKDIAGRTQKEWYIDNKEKKKEYHKKYNEKNKGKRSEKNKEKYECICGSIIRKSDKLRHQKTKKHINIMLDKEKI